MRYLLRKTRVLLAVNYAFMTEYRAELLLWALAGSMSFIMMGIWMKAAATGAQTGITPAQFARYFITVFLVRQLTVVWVIWEFEFQVNSGRISPYLLQPQDMAWRWVTAHLSEQAARAPFGAAIVALFLLAYPPARWVPSLAQLAMGVSAIYLAFSVRFVMQYTVAMLAFWIERAGNFEQITFGLYLFFSGSMAPLSLYPEKVRFAAMCTPFPYLMWFPASLISGQPTVPYLQGMGVLAAWFLVFLVLNRIMWRWGLRQYSGMGA